MGWPSVDPQIMLVLISFVPLTLWTMKVISAVHAGLAFLLLTFISRRKAAEKQRVWEKAEQKRRAQAEREALGDRERERQQEEERVKRAKPKKGASSVLTHSKQRRQDNDETCSSAVSGLS